MSSVEIPDREVERKVRLVEGDATGEEWGDLVTEIGGSVSLNEEGEGAGESEEAEGIKKLDASM